MKEVKFRCPSTATSQVLAVQPDRHARLLDIGAGTGLLGIEVSTCLGDVSTCLGEVSTCLGEVSTG